MMSDPSPKFMRPIASLFMTHLEVCHERKRDEKKRCFVQSLLADLEY
jgi:hypothetical protein